MNTYVMASQVVFLMLLIALVSGPITVQRWVQQIFGSASPLRTALSNNIDTLGYGIFTQWSGLFFVFLLALLLRSINLWNSWDIFVDEITYLRISEALGHTFRIDLYGEPFHLHPPAFFFLQAGYLHLVNLPEDPILQVYTARFLNVLLSAVSAAVIVYIVQWLSGLRAGILAGVIFALDPFIIRMNSRNYLDTSVMLWVLVGYAILLPAIYNVRQPMSKKRAVFAGMAFGAAILTKDMAVFQTILPIAICCVFGWISQRRTLLLISAVGTGCYLTYVGIIAAVGQWPPFFEQKTRGIERFTGQVQETGFNQSGGPSLIEGILANLDQFGSTYAIIAMGISGTFFLAKYLQENRVRLIVIWSLSSYAQIAYSLLLGTLEEQFFYSLVIPAIVVIVVSCTAIIRSAGRLIILQRLVTFGSIATIAIFLAWSSMTWARVHITTTDNGVEQVVRYIEDTVPNGSRVAYSGAPVEFLLKGYRLYPVESIEDIHASQPEYIVLSVTLLESGHDGGPGAGEMIAWIRARGQPVFAVDERSLGLIQVYEIDISSVQMPRELDRGLFP